MRPAGKQTIPPCGGKAVKNFLQVRRTDFRGSPAAVTQFRQSHCGHPLSLVLVKNIFKALNDEGADERHRLR